jgi:predicted MFS family arabinose efflux permease
MMGFLFSFSLIIGTFMIASFLGPVLVSINHWSERQLAMVYFVAGISTLIVTNMVGRWSDRISRLVLFQFLASGAVVMALVVSNFPLTSLWLATVATSGFMVFAAARMVPAQAMLLTAVSPNIRGAFMSVNTSVQQFATGVSPMIASGLLVENADGGLDGFSLVGLLSACSGGISILLAGFLKSTDGH